MNYNFVEKFKQYLVAVKINYCDRHVNLNVPFYGGFLILDMTIKDGFFTDVSCDVNVLNEVRKISRLEFKFGTADEIAKQAAEVLNELTYETRDLTLGTLKAKEK